MRFKSAGLKIVFGGLFVISCGASLLLGFSSGPPAARTGDFGEQSCTACHRDNTLNSAGGTLSITAPAQYQPGTTYPITVRLERSSQSRWGFQAAVRVVASSQQAGALATADGTTRIQTASGIQYISQSATGTQQGATSGTWTFNWTAPATNVGAVRFSLAGNAANNTGTNAGDFIYTTTATINAAAALPTTALFSHVAVGDGFSTLFTLVNTGATPLTGSLILTGQNGTPLDATLSQAAVGAGAPELGPVLASSFPIEIPSGGTKVITASPLTASDPLKAGWARLESAGGAVSGVATFQLVTGGKLATIAGVLGSETVENATIPVDDDVAANRYTGYAVANPGTDSVTIKVVTVKQDGTAGATLANIVLGPGGQKAQFVSNDPAASQKFQGSVVLMGQGGKKFSVVALVQNQGLYTAIPIVAAKAPGIN